MTVEPWVVTVVTGFIMILLGANAYFVKRLVDRLDTAATDASEAKKSAQSAQTSTAALGGLMREIKADIKDLRRTEIDVAILKSHMGLSPKRKKAPIVPDGEADGEPA